MTSEDGRHTIVFNGEIYNFRELRCQLEAEGHQFRSGGDTEVLLHLYRRDGYDCVQKLNGIFAFAVWDEDRHSLFLARDHFGVKPLYYTETHSGLAFASEAKALFRAPEVDARIDPTALRAYLAFLWVPEPRTLFAGVHKLPAGHFGVWAAGQLRIERYWDLSFPAPGAKRYRPRTDLAAELRERFHATVARQMVSDVPIGAFLSSGLDSSSIVAAMARSSPEPVRTFTIDFPDHAKRGELMDDGEVARRTAAALGCRHTEIEVEPDAADLAPRLIWHMDEPVADPAIVTAYLVSRAAAEQVTVLLSGAGGDELFGGYRKYLAHGMAAQYRRLPGSLRRSLIEPLVERLPSLAGSPIRSHVRLAQKFVRGASLPPAERFIGDSVYVNVGLQNELLSAAWRHRVGEEDPRATHFARFAAVDHADFLHQMLYVDSKTFLPSLNLNYTDKMGMAASVEIRVPFLDHEFASWVANEIPPSAKIDGRRTKVILREAMEPWLPAEVLNQPKAGFGAPIDAWLRGGLRPMVDDLLAPATVARRGMFDPSAVRRLIDEHQSRRREHGYRIWSLLTLELWMRAFLDHGGGGGPSN